MAKLVAAEIEVIGDAGAYMYTTNKVLGNSAITCIGPYFIPNVKSDVYGVYTNNVPGAAFRGFGAPQVDQRRLDEREVDVLRVLEALQECGRLLQCIQEVVLGHAVRRRAPDDHVPIDAPVTQSARHAVGKSFAAAERTSRNGDDGHRPFLCGQSRRPVRGCRW